MQAITTRTTEQAGQLADLADQINAEHRAAESAARSAIDHAHEAGRLLIEAKAHLEHGQWGTWLATNFHGSDRTARAYMRVAKGWAAIAGKTAETAELTIDGALKLLAAPDHTHKETATGRRELAQFGNATIEHRRSTCREWWDVLATRTMILDGAGWEPAEVAEYMGVDQAEVESILFPRPILRGADEFPLFGAGA
ncbi:MAG TPA: DUF3102 domain-containing protein, partial [Pirellulales bacterium]|nr:DUF3102 domain-containing protein [Pirellulales bacterium]